MSDLSFFSLPSPLSFPLSPSSSPSFFSSLPDIVLRGTQNSIQLKTYELLILETSYLMFSNLSGSPVTETVEDEAWDNG